MTVINIIVGFRKIPFRPIEVVEEPSSLVAIYNYESSFLCLFKIDPALSVRKFVVSTVINLNRRRHLTSCLFPHKRALQLNPRARAFVAQGVQAKGSGGAESLNMGHSSN